MAACGSRPSPSWLVRASQEATCSWVRTVVSPYLSWEGAPTCAQGGSDCPLPQETILGPDSPGPFRGRQLAAAAESPSGGRSSGFRLGYGTEAALAAPADDLCGGPGWWAASAPAFPGLSEAFSSISRGILLGQLRGTLRHGACLAAVSLLPQGQGQPAGGEILVSVAGRGEPSSKRPTCGRHRAPLSPGSCLAPE